MSRRIKPFGISVLFCVFSFCVVVHAFADSGEENSLKNLVVLTETPLQKAERWHPGGILVREIFRQAFLVAARDELGLQTRDAVLREQVEYAGVEPFHVESIVELEKGITFKLSLGSGENRRELFSEKIELSPKNSPDYEKLVQRCEEWSRGVFGDLLKAEGFKDERTPSEATATISADLAELIDTMAAIPQTAVIRRLHELARAHQESAELLRALTRAYANLGLLTDFHCNLAHKAFKARSLIYAHRLSHMAESDLTTIWHHAYAWTLTGRLDISLEKIKLGRRQLDDLKEKVKAGEVPPAIPSWGLTIEEYSRQNLRRLWLLARSEKKHRELAYLLAFHSIEFVDDSNLPAVIGEEAINVIPGCFRLHDTYATAVGVSGGHKATRLAPLALNEFLPQQLEAVSGLSDEAKKLAEKSDVGPFGDAWSSLGNRLPKLVRTLVESGDPKKDRGEPSLEFVGRIIEETAFAQVQRRARFMKFMWGVETDVFIAEACPILKDHRYAKLLDAYKYDETTDVDKLKAEFAPIEITDSDTAFLRFHKLMGSLWKTAAPKETPVRQGYWTLWANADVIRNDKAAIHRDYPQGTKTADEILACSPYEASAIATVIKEDWDRAQDEIDDWIEVTGDRGAISIVLADKYFEIGNLKKAKYWYEKTLRTDASREAFQGLAECYKKVGDFDGFIETMKRFLEEGDDYGLDRSIINVEVAKELMRRQEFDKALPYAEAGARSYSFYSLSCAGCCYEALGRYEKAEEMFRNCAERYDDGRLVWYDFCMRTGRVIWTGLGNLLVPTPKIITIRIIPAYFTGSASST